MYLMDIVSISDGYSATESGEVFLNRNVIL